MFKVLIVYFLLFLSSDQESERFRRKSLWKAAAHSFGFSSGYFISESLIRVERVWSFRLTRGRGGVTRTYLVIREDSGGNKRAFFDGGTFCFDLETTNTEGCWIQNTNRLSFTLRGSQTRLTEMFIIRQQKHISSFLLLQLKGGSSSFVYWRQTCCQTSIWLHKS